MNYQPWQHFRDEASQRSDLGILITVIRSLKIDLSGYIFCRLGFGPKELLNELNNSAESRKLAREIWATIQYLNQFESPVVVRNWFIGLHPRYGEISPADLFRSGQAETLINNLNNGERLYALSA